jgi:hypothetical protein
MPAYVELPPKYIYFVELLDDFAQGQSRYSNGSKPQTLWRDIQKLRRNMKKNHFSSCFVWVWKAVSYSEEYKELQRIWKLCAELNIYIVDLWVMIMPNLVSSYQCFRQIYCLHHQCRNDDGTHKPDYLVSTQNITLWKLRVLICRMWCSHSGGYEEFYLLGCVIV